MNNNYFNPNASFMRSAPSIGNAFLSNPVRMAPQVSVLPRISSLLGGASSASAVGGTSKITFSQILNGTSKTLGVINQAIPVFYQVKPIWNNARTMFRVAKELSSGNTNSNKNVNISKNNINSIKKETEDNSPTFFV